MTPVPARLDERYAGHAAQLEAELLSALWEEVPFPRLPPDAPPELKDLLINIENPRRVYTIHRASRRHHVQILIEKFVLQLRHGCGYADCPTSSCFSCRKRLAGRAPIRRYSPASARTLAVYLASQDNPELYLCPHLSPLSEPSDAIKPLLFVPRRSNTASDTLRRPTKRLLQGNSLGHAATVTTISVARATSSPPRQAPPTHQAKDEEGQGKIAMEHQEGSGTPLSTASHGDSILVPGVNIAEKYSSKDYRSFAANMFGTVAFKMMEWLTPMSFDGLNQKALDASENARSASEMRQLCAPIENSQSSVDQTVAKTGAPKDEPTFGRRTSFEQRAALPLPLSRRDSNTRIRPPHHGKPSTRLDSMDEALCLDAKIASPTRTNAPDIHQKNIVRSPSVISRSSAPVSIEDEADDPSEDEASEHGDQDDKLHLYIDGANREGSSTSGEIVDTPDETSMTAPTSDDQISSPDLESFLPQTLTHITPQAVQFICDVLQTDATADKHTLVPSALADSHRVRLAQQKSLRRRKRSDTSEYPQGLRFKWKLFIEQVIFSSLSEPQTLLRSFTTSEGIIDSQSLWYCMLRLTRVAPELVLDSLWLALADVFRPPRTMQSPSTTEHAKRAHLGYSNEEAGALMSICFHALVAAAPVVTEYRQLADMSRIRSHGLVLASGAALAHQPASLCLQYEDIFTDDLALRLARRLLSAISARQLFDSLPSTKSAVCEADCKEQRDVIELILSHIDTSAQSYFEFSKHDRILHEKRVPILLLDWARAVMIQDWDGEPDVDADGAFGGALSLLKTMYQKRQNLLLGDVHFRSEYFGERLDCIKMPVSWLTFTSTRKRSHLLDHPYLFNPASLVSYFRAINFSRMSRSYEESTSLRSRIGAVIAPESLVTDPHHKNVLQDLLKVPSTRYLILDISRKDVLRDAFDQLWRRESRELMRPLKVHLGEDSGEEGFDSGGVQQEFFRLAIAEALHPDNGAFTVDERTRMTWFQPSTIQPEWKLELIGLLISLAVYNGLTLPVTFPKALYQKLLGEPVTELHHIADGWPDLANGLTNLLEWSEKDGAVEDVFVLTYEFSTSMFGQPISRIMKPGSDTAWPQFPSRNDAPLPSENPADAPMVTGDNRQAYVDDYIRYLTGVSIAPQFEAFARGFRTCLHPKALTLLTPTLLQSIVEGAQDIDISELRRAARYVGWDASHRAVRDFWSIVKKYDDRMKRKLLEFVTASDRVPVGGVANIQFIIQKNGEEEGEGGHLPTAYTCYGTLLLPQYPSREVLKERLSMALENAQGFGFA